MKRFITILSAVLFITGAVQAQSFSAGARMGASCLEQGFDHKYISFDQSVFGRYETGSRWAFEAGFGHWSGGMKTNVPAGMNEGPGNIPAHARINNYEMNLSVQYDITCPYMQEHCPVMRRIKTYASLDISPTLSYTRLLYNDTEDFMAGETAHRKNDVRLWTGLSETMLYQLNDHVNLVSNVGFKVNGGQLFNPGNDYEANFRFSWQVGAAYKF